MTQDAYQARHPAASIRFDAREAATIKDAAWKVGKPTRTIYRWCVDHGIGRPNRPAGLARKSPGIVDVCRWGPRHA